MPGRAAIFAPGPNPQWAPLVAEVGRRGFGVLRKYGDIPHLMISVRRGVLDAVFVLRLTDLARSTRHLSDVLGEFKKYGVDFVSLNEGIDTTTDSQFIAHVSAIVSAIVEFEHAIQSEKIHEGLDRARRQGKRLGRPFKNDKNSRNVNRDPEKVFKANAKMRVMADKAPAEFLMSSLEYRAVFREPIFSAFETRTEIVKVLYDAFREWNVTFEDITLRSVVMTANDLQVGCDLLSKRVTFTVMLNSCTLVVTNPNWSEAPLIQQLVERGLGAVHAIGGAVWNQTVTLAMHIRGAGQSRLERTARFRPSLTGGPPTKKELGFAFCVYADDISWLIDLSAVYSDALFVKIVRSFEASITFDQIGATLYNDEREVLDLVELTLV